MSKGQYKVPILDVCTCVPGVALLAGRLGRILVLRSAAALLVVPVL